MKITRKEMEKRSIKACIVLAFLAFLLAVAVYQPAPVQIQRDAKTVSQTDAKEQLVFWYDDIQYEKFFEKCAADYADKTGVQVKIVLQDSVHYINEIYDGTMQEGEYPDVYLSSTDQLQRLKLAGIAAADDQVQNFEQAGVDARAIQEAQTDGVFYGYVFAFETPMLVTQKGYFTEEMTSLQQMMEYAVDHEMENEEEVLFKWNISDVMYNYIFLGNYIDMQVTADGGFSYEVQEQTQNVYEFLASLSQMTAVDDAEKQSDVLDAIRNHMTMTAIVNSSDLQELKEADVEVSMLPTINEELDTQAMSIVDACVVNAYSKHLKDAQEFAVFVALEEAENVQEYAGHYPVISSLLTDDTAKTVYAQYEESTIKPDSMEAENFFLNLQADFLEQWNLNAQ